MHRPWPTQIPISKPSFTGSKGLIGDGGDPKFTKRSDFGKVCNSRSLYKVLSFDRSDDVILAFA